MHRDFQSLDGTSSILVVRSNICVSDESIRTKHFYSVTRFKVSECGVINHTLVATGFRRIRSPCSKLTNPSRQLIVETVGWRNLLNGPNELPNLGYQRAILSKHTSEKSAGRSCAPRSSSIKRVKKWSDDHYKILACPHQTGLSESPRGKSDRCMLRKKGA